MHIESPTEPSEMADFAQRYQSDPTTSHVYFSQEAPAIVVELEELPDWPSVAFVARDQDMLGWLAAEIDDDMGRVWWWGPVADDPAVADALYEAAVKAHGSRFSEEELAADVRNVAMARFADRHGFAANPASLALELHSDAFKPAASVRVHEPSAEERRELAALHDRLFPGTHSPGSTWLDDTEDILFVASDVTGYVVAQTQADGTGYIDYLGVAPEHRRKGAAASLVSAACEELWRREVSNVHLTVRANESGAQALYHGLGFVTALELVPYRRGFTLE